MVGTSQFVGEEFIWKCFELFFEKVWLFPIKTVPLNHENPPSLFTMLKSAGRFVFQQYSIPEAVHLCERPRLSLAVTRP
jgi:hypothetical protein